MSVGKRRLTAIAVMSAVPMLLVCGAATTFGEHLKIDWLFLAGAIPIVVFALCASIFVIIGGVIIGINIWRGTL